MPLVQLFFDLQNKCLVRGFNNSIQTGFPNCFQGDTLTLQMRFMNPTGNQAVPYVDADESAAYVQVGIGTIAGLPTSGTFTITDPDAPQTTAGIAWNASAATVQAAIQAGLTTHWSTATVTGNAGGPWTITNGVNAARSALTIQGNALIPASQGQVEVQAAGSGSTPAIQWARLMLSPIAYQDSWTAYPAPAVAISNIQTGGVAGSNSIQGITLNNQPYAGTFTISFGGYTTGPIPYNASTPQVQTALQALTSIGSGNVSVGGIVGAYQVTFIGTLGGAAQAAFTASATGLTGPLMLVGTLSLATVGIEEAIGEAQFITQTFEVNITPSGGDPQTILQTGVQINNDLIPNAPALPTPTSVYLSQGAADARYAQQANNGSDFTSVLTTFKNLWASLATAVGDLIYGGTSGAATRLAGNSSATKKFLTQTGTGSASAAPAWNTIAPGDLPVATTGAFGAVKPDGSTITILSGVISANGVAWPLTSTDGAIQIDGTAPGSGTAINLNSDGSAWFAGGASDVCGFDGGGNLFVNDETAIDNLGGVYLHNYLYDNASSTGGTGDVLIQGGGLYWSSVLIDSSSFYSIGMSLRFLFGSDGTTVNLNWDTPGIIYPPQSSSAPSYALGAMYYDTTLKKLRIGGASAWETVTSV